VFSITYIYLTLSQNCASAKALTFWSLLYQNILICHTHIHSLVREILIKFSSSSLK